MTRVGMVCSMDALDLVTIDQGEARVKRMRRSVLTTARLSQEWAQHQGERYKVAMLTLTYAREDEWQPGHISALLKCIREYTRRRKLSIRYVWVMELTKSGRPHYHILLWLPRGFSLPKPDKRGWWRHGSTRIEWVKRAVGYLAKYASKADSRTAFPKGARISGFGGLEFLTRLVRRWWMLPGWLRGVSAPAHDLIRCPGGGFVSRGLDGLVVPSPWRLAAFGRGRVVVRLAGVPLPPLPVLRLSVLQVPAAWQVLGMHQGEAVPS